MKTSRFRGLAVAVTMAIWAGPALADSRGDHDTMMDEMADMDGVMLHDLTPGTAA